MSEMQCCEDGLKELKIFGFCRNLMCAGSWRGRKEYLREKENWKEKKKEEQEEANKVPGLILKIES